MAIVVAALDEWEGTSYIERTISRPVLREIHELFAIMDGRTRGILTIETDHSDRRGMTVGGGPDLFLCYVSNFDSDMGIWNLRGDLPPDQRFKLWTGGQEGDFAGHYLSGRDKIRSVMDYFFVHEDRHPEMKWFEQQP